jgi:hypothetical protein
MPPDHCLPGAAAAADGDGAPDLRRLGSGISRGADTQFMDAENIVDPTPQMSRMASDIDQPGGDSAADAAQHALDARPTRPTPRDHPAPPHGLAAVRAQQPLPAVSSGAAGRERSDDAKAEGREPAIEMLRAESFNTRHVLLARYGPDGPDIPIVHRFPSASSGDDTAEPARDSAAQGVPAGAPHVAFAASPHGGAPKAAVPIHSVSASASAAPAMKMEPPMSSADPAVPAPAASSPADKPERRVKFTVPSTTPAPTETASTPAPAPVKLASEHQQVPSDRSPSGAAADARGGSPAPLPAERGGQIARVRARAGTHASSSSEEGATVTEHLRDQRVHRPLVAQHAQRPSASSSPRPTAGPADSARPAPPASSSPSADPKHARNERSPLAAEPAPRGAAVPQGRDLSPSSQQQGLPSKMPPFAGASARDDPRGADTLHARGLRTHAPVPIALSPQAADRATVMLVGMLSPSSVRIDQGTISPRAPVEVPRPAHASRTVVASSSDDALLAPLRDTAPPAISVVDDASAGHVSAPSRAKRINPRHRQNQSGDPPRSSSAAAMAPVPDEAGSPASTIAAGKNVPASSSDLNFEH